MTAQLTGGINGQRLNRYETTNNIVILSSRSGLRKTELLKKLVRLEEVLTSWNAREID